MQRRMTGTSEAARLRLAAVAAEYLERMGQRIRQRREELGLSRADVARAMPGKTNENAIYRWEKGAHRPQDDTLEALARVLKLDDWTWFIAADQEKTSAPDLFQVSHHRAESDIAGAIAGLVEAIAQQNELLRRQSDILERIEARLDQEVIAADRIEAATESLGGAAAELDAAVQRVVKAPRSAPPGNASRDSKSKPSRTRAA